MSIARFTIRYSILSSLAAVILLSIACSNDTESLPTHFSDIDLDHPVFAESRQHLEELDKLTAQLSELTTAALGLSIKSVDQIVASPEASSDKPGQLRISDQVAKLNQELDKLNGKLNAKRRFLHQFWKAMPHGIVSEVRKDFKGDSTCSLLTEKRNFTTAADVKDFVSTQDKGFLEKTHACFAYYADSLFAKCRLQIFEKLIDLRYRKWRVEDERNSDTTLFFANVKKMGLIAPEAESMAAINDDLVYLERRLCSELSSEERQRVESLIKQNAFLFATPYLDEMVNSREILLNGTALTDFYFTGKYW